MKSNEINVQVKHSVFNPGLSESDPANKVQVRKWSDDTFYYRVFIFIDGYDLPYVESVTYALDDTFPDPIQTVRRSPANPNCQLVVWTWKDQFTVAATIADKRGNSYAVTHDVTYVSELPTMEDRYEFVETELQSGARPTLVSV